MSIVVFSFLLLVAWLLEKACEHKKSTHMTLQELYEQFEPDRLYTYGTCITFIRIGKEAFDLAIREKILLHCIDNDYYLNESWKTEKQK